VRRGGGARAHPPRAPPRPRASRRTRRPPGRDGRPAERLGAAGSRSNGEASRVQISVTLGTYDPRMPLPKTKTAPSRILIQDVRPQVDCGRYAVKAVAGDRVA